MNKRSHLLRNETGSVFWAVLAVLLMVSALFSTVVVSGIWHQAQNRSFLHQRQAKYLAFAAVERLKWELDREHLDLVSSADLELSDSLPGRRIWQVTAHPWGCFWRAVCTGKSHRETWAIDILIGRSPLPQFANVLSLFGPPYPLVVAGETQILGDVALGPAGVTAGRYEGRRYRDSILIHGQVRTDPPPAPSMFNWTVWENFETRTNRLRETTPLWSDRVLIIDDAFAFVESDSVIIVNADVTISRHLPLRAKRPVYLMASGTVSITGSTNLEGRWVIFSQKSIQVTDSAQLAGVILHAPHISIMGESIFSGQAVADTLLAISGNARTIFPTLLWSKGAGASLMKSTLELASSERCEGIAVAAPITSGWTGTGNQQNVTELILSPDALWVGYLYTSGRAQLQGIVWGSVGSSLLYLHDPPTTYLNWLVDCRLDRDQWDGYAVLPAFFVGSGKWVNAEIVPM